MSFGEWVVMERDKREMSQGDLEAQTGISHSHMSKIENGRVRNPADTTRARFHRVFGTSDDDLVEAGLLTKRPRMGGGFIYEPTKMTTSIAADMGERAAIAAIIDDMPDEAVQHLRLFLEAITDA